MTISFLTLYFLISLIILVLGLQTSQEARYTPLLKRYITDDNGKIIDLNKEPSPVHNIVETMVEGKQFAKNQQVEKSNLTLKTNPKAESRYKILNPRRPIIIPVSLY